MAAYGHACGVRVQRVLRVLRFDAPLARGLWYRRFTAAEGGLKIIEGRHYDKTKQPRPWREKENRQTGPLARWKYTPIPACGGTSPGGGSLLSAFLSASLSHSLYSTARISPSGGDAAAGGRRGAFSSRQRRGCMVFQRAKRVWLVFPRAKPGCKGFIVPPLAEGKVVAPATKGGPLFPRPKGGCMVLLAH